MVLITATNCTPDSKQPMFQMGWHRRVQEGCCFWCLQPWQKLLKQQELSRVCHCSTPLCCWHRLTSHIQFNDLLFTLSLPCQLFSPHRSVSPCLPQRGLCPIEIQTAVWPRAHPQSPQWRRSLSSWMQSSGAWPSDPVAFLPQHSADTPRGTLAVHWISV